MSTAKKKAPAKKAAAKKAPAKKKAAADGRYIEPIFPLPKPPKKRG